MEKSTIQGQGLVADAPISKGEKVVVAKGCIREKDTLPEQAQHPHTWLPIPGRKNLVLFTETSRPFSASFLNHSCSPNLSFVFPEWIACREIGLGEELLTDYGSLGYPEEMVLLESCNCQSGNCRGQILSRQMEF